MVESTIEPEEFFSLLEKLMNTPTAPFREHKIRNLVISEVARRPRVTVKEDQWGNLLVSYENSDHQGACVLSAHMDHPGFVDGEFLGSIASRYLNPDNRVAEYDTGIGVWDVPAFERCDLWIRGRACDDLVGCAVALATVFHHARAGSTCNVHALLTVAEEVGLFGAALACDAGTIPAGAVVLSLETSPALTEQQFHEGCIVRVGDRRSVFSPLVTKALVDLAALQGIKHQRRLMDGGTCEGTVYYDAGYQTGALCVALGYAHNQGPNHGIAMEYVSLTDTTAMLRLAIVAASDLQEMFTPQPPQPPRLQAMIERAKSEVFLRCLKHPAEKSSG
jgi:putative aminopeptidase FrvX